MAQQEFNRAAAVDDKLFNERHPELGDAKTRARVAEGVYEYAQAELGLDRQQLQHLYNTSEQLRSYQGQELLLAGWRQYEAKKALRAGRVRPTPPVVQRPGVQGDAPSREDARVSQAMQRLAQTGSVKDAARALAARRAAARRSR